MGDKVQPLIDQITASVKGITSGDGRNGAALTPAELAQIRKDNPGISPEFQRASSTADKNSPVFKQKGLDSEDNYTAYWYNQMRDPKAYSLPAAGGADNPTQTATDLTKTATDTTATAIDNLTKTTTSLVGDLQAQNTSLTGLINSQAASFQKSQSDLLAGFQKAQADSATQMGALVKSLQDQISGTGQAAKKPNYARALAANRALNSGGLSSTMLTGPTGVASSGLTLGRTSLMGA